jgi:hypothetical protein
MESERGWRNLRPSWREESMPPAAAFLFQRVQTG